ncbi:MAG: ribonuclease H-like domain-containing protein [Lachnospiraceae bacterium]|nr:ribonuclease H-like domain-containing protein [Lachnospiraceae bacterium]
MLHFESTLSVDAELGSLFSKHPAEVLFFDIETTGFSATSSYVYLIGAIAFSGDRPILHQWFLDDISEEKLLIQTFLHYASGFQKLVHYNGSTFDLPYLQKKCQRHRLTFSLDALESIDVYRLLAPFKRFLPLTDWKQKTVEHFLGLHREDPFSGGDLIPVYTEYLAKARLEALRRQSSSAATLSPDFSDTGLRHIADSPAKALLSTLLLHNHEDLTGLCSIICLLRLSDFLQGAFSVTAAVKEDALTLTLSADASLLPESVASRFSQTPLYSKVLPQEHRLTLQLLADGSGAALTLPVWHTTLKYFFDNYKEYYYLPQEDRAIHKSVAEFVEPEFRQKATRETCYQKKTGTFLFQPTPEQAPAFREHSKDKHSFFLLSEDFLQSEDKLTHYAKQLLSWILTK